MLYLNIPEIKKETDQSIYKSYIEY